MKSPQGKYTIEGVLGSGGFGITYRASTRIQYGNINTKVTVAIKEHFMGTFSSRNHVSGAITPLNSADARAMVEDSLKEFRREGVRLAEFCRLSENIVNVNEIFEANGTAYYVMEYLDGESLQKYLNRRGALPEAEVRNIMGPIVAAMGRLHRERITHLDIKPDNIMVTSSGVPMLIDFGFAKQYDTRGRSKSQVYMQGRTPGYAPPEQNSRVETFSPGMDVYALGATILHCLTGRIPTDSNQWERGEPARTIDSLRVSPLLKTLLRKAMQQSRFDRYADATEMARTWGVRETNATTTGPQPEQQQLGQEEFWSRLTEPKEFSLCVERGDNTYYLTLDDWKRLPGPWRKEVEKIGLVLNRIGEDEWMMLDLEDIDEGQDYWTERHMGGGDKEDWSYILSNLDKIQSLLKSFGAEPLASKWTSPNDNECPFYVTDEEWPSANFKIKMGMYVNIFDRSMFYAPAFPKARYRGVGSCGPGDNENTSSRHIPPQSNHSHDRQVLDISTKPHRFDLAVELNGQRYFWNETKMAGLSEDLKQMARPLGIVVQDRTGGFFIVGLRDAVGKWSKAENMTWADALSSTGGHLPDKGRATVIIENFQTLQGLLKKYGGDPLNGWYFTNSTIGENVAIYNPSQGNMLNIAKTYRYKARPVIPL